MRIDIDSIQEALRFNLVGSCTCSTKSNKLKFHNKYCLYFALSAADKLISFYRTNYPTGISYEQDEQD